MPRYFAMYVSRCLYGVWCRDGGGLSRRNHGADADALKQNTPGALSLLRRGLFLGDPTRSIHPKDAACRQCCYGLEPARRPRGRPAKNPGEDGLERQKILKGGSDASTSTQAKKKIERCVEQMAPQGAPRFASKEPEGRGKRLENEEAEQYQLRLSCKNTTTNTHDGVRVRFTSQPT